VREKSLQAIKDKVRAKTRRCGGESVARIIADLDPMLRGWFGYFKHAAASTLRAPDLIRGLDGCMRRRLRAILRQQEKRPGIGHRRNDHQRRPKAFFADPGLFTFEAAHQQARHSR
jgi:RNA-directed DNA polymerase